MIRPFHFTYGQALTVQVPEGHDSHLLSPLHGMRGVCEGESTTMPGYYHVRITESLAHLGYTGRPLFLVPWAFLHVAEDAHVSR